jgi:hypothetical protein
MINPSLQLTAFGMALGPRGALCTKALRGPSAMPVATAELEC